MITALIKGVADAATAPAALKLAPGIHRLAGIEFGELAPAFWETQLGAYDLTLERLQRWVANAPTGQRFNGIRYLWLPAFDPVRADPRFKVVFGKLGVPDQLAQDARP